MLMVCWDEFILTIKPEQKLADEALARWQDSVEILGHSTLGFLDFPPSIEDGFATD